MTLILIIAIIWGASALARATKEAARQKEIDRQRREQAARSAELARMTAEWKQRQAEAKIETQRLIALEREQMRQAKEQERQAAQLAKHEAQIMKLEQRMASAESELAFNREQRERLFTLLDIEELERDASIHGGKEWQKHQKKVISLENQIHTVQKRIDKAHADKAFCEKQMEVA